MPYHKLDPYLADKKSRHHALFVFAAFVVAGLCTLKPQGIFRDYDHKERKAQNGRVRDLDERRSRWSREQENQYYSDDESPPPREARYHSSRDGRTAPPPSRDLEEEEEEDSESPTPPPRSHHRERSPPPKKKRKKKGPDPFSWQEIIMGLG